MPRRIAHALRVPFLLPRSPRVLPSLLILIGSLLAAAALFLFLPHWSTGAGPAYPGSASGPRSPRTIRPAAVASRIRGKVLDHFPALAKLPLPSQFFWQYLGAGTQIHALTIDAQGNVDGTEEAVSASLNDTLKDKDDAPKLIGLEIAYAQRADPILAPVLIRRSCSINPVAAPGLPRVAGQGTGNLPANTNMQQLADQIRSDWQRYPQYAPPAWVRRNLPDPFAPGVHDLGTRIVWPGVAWNLALFAALAALLFSPLRLARAIHHRRRDRRIAEGLCPRCAYRTAGVRICPECGFSYD